MIKEMEKISEETKQFNKVVYRLFEILVPSVHADYLTNWLLLMFYLAKNKALCVVDKDTCIDGNIVVFSCVDNNMMIVVSSEQYSDIWCDFQRLESFLSGEKIFNLLGQFEVDDITRIKLSYRHQIIRDVVNTFISLSDTWYAENSSSAFDMMVESIYERLGVHFPETTQPKELTELVGRLLDADYGLLYNPYAGICSYSQIVRPNVRYYGQEKSFSYFIGKLKCLILGINDFEIMYDDSLKNWLGDYGCFGFDYIVSTPPFGRKLDETVSRWHNMSLDFLVNSMRDARRKSIGVYPVSLCSAGYSRSVIKDVLAHDILDTVVLLPKSIFHQTAIQTAIIVVNKEKTYRGFVRFIDASECFNKDGRKNVLDFETISTLLDSDSDNRVKMVSNDEIIDKDCSINPKLYTQLQEVAFPEGYEIVDFRDILEQCPTQKQYYAEDGYIAKIPQLSTDSFDCERKVEDFEYFISVDNVVKVEEPVILISRIREAKPTYCIASPEKPLFVHSNVIPFRIKKDCEWVEPHYLCLELSNRIKNISFGAIIPSLSINRLVNVQLALPSRSFDEQKRIFDAAVDQYKLSKAKEMGLQEVIEKLKSDHMNEVRARRHDMSPHIGVLDMIECKLRQYVGQIDMGEDMSKKMIRALDYYRTALDELKKIVDVLSQENEFGKSEVIDLNVYFQGRLNNTSGYAIEYTCDSYVVEEELIETPWLVNVDSRYFARVVNNIIVNAEKHGFVDSERKDYKLDIRLGLNDDRTMYQIDFANNGKSLPAGFDKRLYGIRGEKAGRTAGSGIGGHIVKSFVENYNGNYDLFMDNNEVVIRILLPIFRKGE